MIEPYGRSFLYIEQSPEKWRAALSILPYSHPLQSWAWGDFKSRWGWSSTPMLLKVLDDPSDASPLGAALVLKRDIPKTRLSILYVPKGPALDYKDRALRRVMLAQLEQLARREKAIFVKIDPDVIRAWGEEDSRKSPIGSKFIEELSDRGWRFSQDQIQFKNTVELDLELDEESILKAMKQKTRYNIRLAERKDVKIRLGTSEDFAAIAELYQETSARDEFTIRPKAYYLDAWRTFHDADMAQPFIAEFEGEMLAAVIIVHLGDRALYMYGASSSKERKRMPNHLLQWEAIRWSKGAGCKVYDFWGAPDEFIESDPLWGVWRFKSGFNGQIVQHIGAWDFASKPFYYWLYTSIIPRYLDFLRSRKEDLT